MGERAPTVAVALPAWNVAPFIDEVLASVAAQTRPADEVILVDDASTDDTVERARRWEDRLPLRIIELEQNVGAGAARSVAIRAASADIIAPLDGDDLWLPRHLAVVCDCIVDQRTIVATKQLAWSGGPHDEAVPDWLDIPPPGRQLDAILDHNFLFSGSVYWRNTLLAGADGPSDLRLGEDYDTWIRLIWNAGCVVVPAPEPTVLYRSRPDSLSADEGCLIGTIEMLQRYLDDEVIPAPPNQLHRIIRRREARRRFLDALTTAEDGKPMRARRQLIAAAASDPTLWGGLKPAERGSVLLRSIVALGAPGRVADRRRRQLSSSGTVTPR
jgi:glycosyltransferase involved in cell wall biosynthesis